MADNSSHREIEAKILNVNPEEVKAKLKSLGAALESEVDLEQVIWWPKGNKKTSIRVRRDKSDNATLTMKEKVDNELGYHEWESKISGYNQVMEIIDFLLPDPDLRIEFSLHRENWRLGHTLITVNWVPKLDPFIEIEAESEEMVGEVAQKLGFSKDTLLNKGIVSLLFDKLNLKGGVITL